MEGEHESALRSQDNERGEVKQPPGRPTGEAPRRADEYGMTGLVGHDHECATKAEHHPPVTGRPHTFPQPDGRAHGFGHGSDRRDGALRLSGHEHAHRIVAPRKGK